MPNPDARLGDAGRGMPARSEKRHEAKKQGCTVTELFHTLGKTHMLNILHVFTSEPGPHRFVDIQHRLSLSPNTLAERLKDLVGAGLLTRTVYNEIPPRVDYEATKKAYELTPLFDILDEWAARNDLKPQVAPLQAVR